jgi:3-hydroxyisobutyrate dehydrogenase-like beta-hydroxyacid dehydrogenase
MTAPAPVGMIGLGLMGIALSARLIDAGIAVTGFDIDADRCKTLKAMGGVLAITATELAARCRTIVLAVYNAEQIETLLAELERSEKLANTTLICTTTCAPDEIVRIAKRADDAGLSLVETPISGTSA